MNQNDSDGNDHMHLSPSSMSSWHCMEASGFEKPSLRGARLVRTRLELRLECGDARHSELRSVGSVLPNLHFLI